MRLLDWQVDMLRDWSATDGQGQFVHRRCGGSIPRQAGKSTVARAWVIALVVNGYRVLWTDHNYSTTCEMRRCFQDVFGRKPSDPQARHPEFNALVSMTNNNTGQEAMEFSTGGVLCFSTRTKSATLGYSFDVIVYDEAQELTDEQQQAILPTFTSGAMHNPQALFLGTPTRPGSPGTVFRRVRADAHEGGDAAGDLSWWEWGVAEVGDVLDETRWRSVNPSLPDVANVEAIRTATRLMDDLGFAQEFLGYWLPDGRSEPPEVGREEWAALATDDPPREDGIVVYAFKFSPDGAHVALAACRKPDEGAKHVEILAYRPLSEGMSWCADFCEERKATAAAFVVDGGGNARDLCDELRRRKVPKKAVVAPAAADVAAACAKLLNGIRERSFTHFGQPALDECIAMVKKRQIGRTGFGFEGIDGTDPTMAEAVALALWGADYTKRDPRRKGRAGC